MAQRITFWKMSGKEDYELKSYRLKSKADIAPIMAKMPEGTDVATLDRTDKQSHISHEIWKSSRYRDLNER